MAAADHKVVSKEPEAELCRLPNECWHCCAQIGSTEPPLELRVAGGSVRDKLLGVPSNNLNIAISSLTGSVFAKRLSKFIKSSASLTSAKLGNIATIKARPEQIQHLQTAITIFLGLELDFVQLQSKEYTKDSRIPSTVHFGTPREDVMCRDNTIKALLYNILTGLMKDLTEEGLADLVRTPLPVQETFKHNPLRLLHCIRFATRSNFKLHPDIFALLHKLNQSGSVHESLYQLDPKDFSPP